MNEHGSASDAVIKSVEEKVDKLGQATEEQNSGLRDELARLKRVNESQARRLAAAETLIDASSKKLREQAQELASTQRLVKAGVRRARKERRHRVNMGRKLQASEELLTTAVGRLTVGKKEEFDAYRKALAKRLPNPQEAYRVLSSARSIEEMNRTYRSLKRMGGAKPARRTRREGRGRRTHGKLPVTEQGGKTRTEKANPAGTVKKPPTQEQKVLKGLINRTHRTKTPGAPQQG